MAWTSPRTWAAGEVETAAFFNPQVRDNLNWLEPDAGGWIAVGTGTGVGNYQNGWGAYPAPYGGAKFTRVGPFTVLKGLIAGGSWQTVAFTLPSGYCPFRQFFISAASAQAQPRSLEIDSAGEVFLEAYGNGGSNAWVSVACVFPTNL